MTTISSAHSREVVFYLGTFTNNTASQGLYAGRLDLDSGELSPITLAAEAKNPLFCAISPDGKFLYAAMESDGGAVGAFAIKGDGSLDLLNVQPSGGDVACHVSLDAEGRHVFVANYNGGNIACFPIQPDGSLGARTAFVQFSGSGPDLGRQKKAFAHGIYSSPDDRFVYVCDLGSDKVWSFQFDKTHGTLTPTDPPAGIVPPGGGPRHLAFHPNGKFVYANNEMGLSTTVFARDADTGVLTALQTVPTSLADEGPLEGVTTSEIICHPNGKWLYVSVRAGGDYIAHYDIAPDGRLTLVENVPSGVQVPAGMALDPTGKWIVVAGNKDGKITVLKINPENGNLSSTGESVEAPAGFGITFATQKYHAKSAKDEKERQ